MRLIGNSYSAFLMAAVVVVSSLVTASTKAVPYASAVRNTTGNTYEFVLNEPADSVTVLRDGGNAVSLGALSAGRHTFDMAGFTSFSIGVTNSAPAGWATIHGAGNSFSNFTLPTGLAINTDPASPYFGTVYVAHANTTPTEAGRAMGDGIYSLTADMIGVNLASNFAVVTDPNDTTQAKAPGFTVSGSTSSSPWRLALDEAGNVIVSDWSDPGGGIKYASPDLTTGGLILGALDFNGNPVADGTGTGPQGGVWSEEFDAFGRLPLHGSIATKAYVTGSVGNGLTVWAMDEDLDVNLSHPGNDGNSIWRWDVGSATNFTEFAPELVINVGALPTTSDGRSNFLNLNIGVAAGAHYDPTFDKWYLVQPRANGNEACIIVVTPDGIDGNSPILEWSSLQFSIDNNLDGISTLEGIQDMFYVTRDVTISPDGKFLVVNRSSAVPAQHGLGGGSVVLIPLDESGVPAIEVEGGLITNVETLDLVNDDLAHSSGAQLEFDAAGNLYVSHSGLVTGNPAATAQLIQVFSPGGSWIATTSSDGTFNLEAFTPSGIEGDYNEDQKVDAADYVLWRKNPDAFGGAGGYDIWKQNFGASVGAGTGSQVPEPASLSIVLLGMVGFGLLHRRRK